MISSNVIKTASLLFSMILVMACAAKQDFTENKAEIEQQPKLLFLAYQISKTDITDKSITLKYQKVTDGKLKGKPKTIDKMSFGDLQCITLDQDSIQIGTHSIKNPLIKTVEFINDLGNFEKKIIDLDSVQFTIKLQLQSKVKYIRISELTELGTKKHITTKLE